MDIINQLSKELRIKAWQTQATIKLIDEGNSIPFIARYRKEATGSLNDETLRLFDERLKYLRNLEDKKKTVLSTIELQNNLTEEIKNSIDNAITLVELEDIYRPYKPKKRTRATIAKEHGLVDIADKIKLNTSDIEIYAKKFISEEFDTIEKVIDGAKDIIAEDISDNADIRANLRRHYMLSGIIRTKAKDKEISSPYELYYDFSDQIRNLTGYRVLAINRAEDEKIITVNIEVDVDYIIGYICKFYEIDKENRYYYDAVVDSYKRLISPSINREVRNTLTENAQDGAIVIFKKNLSQLLMQPPIKDKIVLGWDPAFRTGCKLSVVSETGKVLHTTIIYPTAPQNNVKEAKEKLNELVDKYKVNIISLGNGTASRESEQIIVEFIKESKKDLSYVIVNEAGASVYSASKHATDEFPTLSEGARSSISIARRLQDPLAELVKIDPKAIGVGQYQHDIKQKKLAIALDGVVENCVNSVGADINTASVALLERISGLSKAVCANIVEYRDKIGKFTNRKQLLDVPKLGNKMFEQCAGFLRVIDSSEPLDETAVHPERYEQTYKLLSFLGFSKEDIMKRKKINITKELDIKSLSEELNIGEITLADIIKEITQPSRDPRDDMPKPILRSDVLSMDDLVEGMKITGTVRNVVDFGAFIDIGVHEDGLVHISQISSSYIKHPSDVLKVGDIVEVKIIGIDKLKKRISLSMKM